jgi:peroxiredoxin
LPVSREQNVSLNDYRGQKNVVLAFYPLDFTGG